MYGSVHFEAYCIWPSTLPDQRVVGTLSKRCPDQGLVALPRSSTDKSHDSAPLIPAEEKKYTEALEACRLLASVSPSWDILKDVGCCLVDDPDSSSEVRPRVDVTRVLALLWHWCGQRRRGDANAAQDGAKFLKAYLEGADETDKKTADYQEAKDVLAKTNL